MKTTPNEQATRTKRAEIKNETFRLSLARIMSVGFSCARDTHTHTPRPNHHSGHPPQIHVHSIRTRNDRETRFCAKCTMDVRAFARSPDPSDLRKKRNGKFNRSKLTKWEKRRTWTDEKKMKIEWRKKTGCMCPVFTCTESFAIGTDSVFFLWMYIFFFLKRRRKNRQQLKQQRKWERAEFYESAHIYTLIHWCTGWQKRNVTKRRENEMYGYMYKRAHGKHNKNQTERSNAAKCFGESESGRENWQKDANEPNSLFDAV